MFEGDRTVRAFRGLMMAACLALVAGCGNDAKTEVPDPPAASAPASTPVVATVPVNLAATPSNTLVALTWTASSGATSYNVKRSTTKGGPYTQLAVSSSASYNDATVTNNVTYYYVVTAVNAAGESANSAEVSATPVPAISVPSVPTGVAATAADGQVSVTWTASSGATSYHVKRAMTNGGPYTQVAAPTAAAYTDTSVTDGTTYYYVVSAIDSAGESANSAQVSASPAATVANPPPTTLGTWTNVTPSGVDLEDALTCGNYGTESIQSDPAHPGNLYVQFMCQGIWMSTDYGVTWSGPINTGTNGTVAGDCAGGITIAPSSTASVPTIYQSCIRGSGVGFWKSVDGGVNWTRYTVGATSRQDYYPASVDPYDENHLLMAGHEFVSLVESVDGGQTWTSIAISGAMSGTGGTGAVAFINTGNASTTRGNWLWMATQGGNYGTWLTADSGATWAQVDTNAHPAGSTQIYQPDNNGVVFMAGAGSALGSGVLRSTDYGHTWTHVGMTNNESVVIGTSKNLYAMYGYPDAPPPSFELASAPGTGTWIAPNTPSGMVEGAVQMIVVNDGTHNILLGAMWESGVWRYIEP
jgi:hypothetical protein